MISQVKLIAEPWDLGDGGYQVGNFPPLWTEWNGKYRDTVRDFWRGEPATFGEFASRFTGSSDLYEHSGRKPIASINFVVAHDGFTLRDLVSYNEKHNDANGENNQDGESHNRSWNCGVEGPTDDPAINALRLQQQRNFLTTLLLSQGVPMIAHGDELGRTQLGNNNALLPGQRPHLGRLGPRRGATTSCSASPGGWSSCARTTRSSAAGGSSPAARTTAARATSATSPGSCPTASTWTNRLDATAWPGRSWSSSTAWPSRHPTGAATSSATTASWSSSTPTTEAIDLHPAGGGVRPEWYIEVDTPRAPRPPRTRAPAAADPVTAAPSSAGRVDDARAGHRVPRLGAQHRRAPQPLRAGGVTGGANDG